MVLVTLSVVVTIAVLNVNFRSPVTHKLAPWVQYFFIDILPKFLWIERPKKEDDDDNNKDTDSGLLTDIIQVPMMDKFKSYDKNTFGDSFEISMGPPSRFDVAAAGGIGPCFGEPPFPSLPLAGGDEELYSPSCRTTIDGNSEPSPTFEKLMVNEIEKTIEDSRFIAQHVRNKDSFENVSAT